MTPSFFPVSLLLLALIVAPTPGRSAELTVFAAASLSDALQALAPACQQATGHTLRFNFGASGTLTRQIQEGAPADLFLSGDDLRADQLEKSGLLLPDTRRLLLANTLVLVTHRESPALITALADLKAPAIRRIAIGQPETVPAGTYAKQHLEALGLWSAVQPKLIPLDNVRTVLAAVESGNADAGFVYKTDALLSRKIRIAVEVSPAAGPPIVYPIAVLASSPHPDEARSVIAWLASPEVQGVFTRLGFLRTEF